MVSYLLLIVATALIPGLLSPASAEDRKVAVVNGKVILERDLDRQVSVLKGQILDKDDAEPDPERLKQLRAKVLEDLIGRELLYQESRKADVIVKPEEVTAELEAIKRQFGDAAGYDKALKRMKLSEAEMKFHVRQGKAVRRYIDQVIAANVTVSDSELLDYYKKNRESFKRPEMVRAGQIMLRVEKDADMMERQKVKEELLRIRKRIEAGEDFSELAKKFSQGIGAKSGGELGYFPRGKLVQAFEDVVFAMSPGELSDIVETDLGYHLILMHDKRPPSIESFQSAKFKIERFLKQGKIRKGIDAKIAELKKKANVERLLD